MANNAYYVLVRTKSGSVYRSVTEHPPRNRFLSDVVDELNSKYSDLRTMISFSFFGHFFNSLSGHNMAPGVPDSLIILQTDAIEAITVIQTTV